MSHVLNPECRFCTFSVGGQTYGIDILAVREINRDIAVTPAPGSPAYVRGLLNLRGQIVTILNTGVIFGGESAERTHTTRLVVMRNNAELDSRGIKELRTSDDLVGLWVDSVSDVVSVSAEHVKEAPATSDGDMLGALVIGIIQNEDVLIRVLATEPLLNVDSDSHE